MVIHFGTIRLDLHFEDLLTSFKCIFHLRINSCHRSKDGWAGAQCCCKERHGVQVKNFQGDASGGFWSQCGIPPPKQIKQKKQISQQSEQGSTSKGSWTQEPHHHMAHADPKSKHDGAKQCKYWMVNAWFPYQYHRFHNLALAWVSQLPCEQLIGHDYLLSHQSMLITSWATHCWIGSWTAHWRARVKVMN